MNTYGEALLRLVYPARCGLCANGLELQEETLCSECSKGLLQLRFSPLEALADTSFEFLDSAWSLFPYEGPIRELLNRVKFGRRSWLINAFHQAASEVLLPLAAHSVFDFMVPIPAGRRRLLIRGFNQSEIIAEQFHRICRIPLKTGLLKKNPGIEAQSSLDREERLANIFGAFKMSTFHRVSGKRILLVDDIFTTGATSEEAARVLKAHGAARVESFTLARTTLKQR